MTRIPTTPTRKIQREPQKGFQMVAEKSYSSVSEHMELEVPRSNILMRLIPIITFDLVVGGTSITGTKNTDGEAAVLSSRLRGNGDDEIFDLVSGTVLRHRSFVKRGQLPYQSGLPATITGTGTHNCEVHLPWDFYDKLSATPHATDLNPIPLSQLIANFEFGSAALLYPNASGTTTLTINNINIRLQAEQVLNPKPGVHASIQQKFVRLGDELFSASDPNLISEFPKGVTIQNFYLFGYHEATVGFKELANGIITTWQWKASNTILQEYVEAERRKMIEQDLEEIATYPTGFVVLQSSQEDGDLRQSIKVTDNSEQKFVINAVKLTNVTSIQRYVDINKTVVAVEPVEGA